MAAAAILPAQTVERVIDVAPAWAGHRVGFDFKTFGDRQYVAFYDGERQMTIGRRLLSEDRFQLTRLPERLGWDSHNFVTLTEDDDGHLHVTGNMHGVPLIYFRSEHPHDIESLRRVDSMVGRDESRVTYPRFLRGPANELIFTYREGGSGRGEEIYNVYDHETQSWRRMLDQPLMSGGGVMNAYPHGPMPGPDGLFHLAWIWRDTPDAETSHTISYARSRDLLNWETSRGEPIPLPITIDTGDVVDPVQPKGGAINGNVHLGFDSRDRVVVSYIKFDENGKTQLYNARSEDGQWVIRQASEWDYRWEFQGRGSLNFEVRSGSARVREGRLTQPYSHPSGSGEWELDEATLRPIGRVTRPSERPAGMNRPQTDFPGMTVRWLSAPSGQPGVRHFLRWETLGVHRDRRPEGDIPDPTPLRLLEVRLD